MTGGVVALILAALPAIFCALQDIRAPLIEATKGKGIQ